MDSMDRVVTIILGGGRGTRLMPLTKLRSKPAVPFGGKYRLVDIPISNCIHAGLTKVFVLTQFNSFSLNRHVNSSYFIKDFRKSFVEIFAAEQTPENMNWFQGTADAVRQVMQHVRNYKPDHVLILSGDQLYTMDLRDLMETHMADEERCITVASTLVDRQTAPELGLLRTGEKHTISEFVEKPKEDAVLDSLAQPDGRFMASMGIYVFNTDTLVKLMDENPDFTDFGREIIPDAMKRLTTRAFVHEGYWEDIGTIRSFFEANLLLTKPNTDVSLYNADKPIYTHARFLPPTHVGSMEVIDSLVCDGCYLDSGRIRDSVIGIRSVLGRKVDLERAVLMGADSYRDREAPDGGCTIGHETVIRQAILDRDVIVGSRVRLENREGHENFTNDLLEVKDGIIVLSKGTRIPDGYCF